MSDTELIDEFVAVIRPLAQGGRYGIAVGGSHGKSRNDSHSDYDFRLYTDGPIGEELRRVPQWPAFAATMAKWEARGTHIDGTWPRRIDVIDRELTQWIAGEGVPHDYQWTVWDYHLPTDIFHQRILDDPFGILAGWKARLTPYPDAMRRAVLARWVSFLSYWRSDYHYRSKVLRGDAVFLAGLSAKLAHAMMQVLCARNGIYFPGDGWNLRLAEGFAVTPPHFAERLTAALYPGDDAGAYETQYERLLALIDEVVGLPG
jgi:hypothetical protein